MQSRSRWLTIAVLAALFALLVAGCASPVAPADEAAAPSDDGGANETLVYATDLTDLITLDPGVAYEFSGVQIVGNIYESLVSFEPGVPGDPVPVLAESWDVAEDGEMWNITFTLDPNATFASGNPVTAEDVAFSWNPAMEINKSPAFLLTDVCNMVNGEINVIDDGTLELKIPNTVSPQVCLAVLSFSTAAVVEKALAEPNMGDDMGESWLNDNSAGSGPYVLTVWDRSVSVTLDENPAYGAVRSRPSSA